MIQRYFIVFLLATMAQVSWGFSLLGPYEPWQAASIGYKQGYEMIGFFPGGPIWLGDIGGPRNIGEEYRRNVPVLYYSFDNNFTGDGSFFGTNGIAAVESAFNIINSLTNLNDYSSDLSEFPMTSQHYNYTAQSLYLTDLKSATLHLLVEQLGLADPARYAWTLHDRDPGPKCPVTATYLVVQRNYDGTVAPSLQNSAYSPYVNGALLSYYITESCSPSFGRTVPFLVDSDGQEFAPVAANNFQDFEEYDTALIWHIPTIYGLQIGGYYTGLTRDDVAGLRYLYSTNNVNIEPVAAQSQTLVISTNFNTQALFPNPGATNVITSGNGTNGAGFYIYDGTYGYGDYGALVAASKTNSPALMQALYPGLLIASSTNYFTLATNETVTSYYTNYPGSPYGTPPTFVLATNGSLYLRTNYVTKFSNVFTNRVYPNTTYTLQTTTVGPKPGAPYGSAFITNVTSQAVVLSNTPSGDFFLFPLFHTNVCPLDILYTGLTNVTSFTNVITAASTNVTTVTNSLALSGSVSAVSYFTNYTYVIYPVSCDQPTNYVDRFQGLGGVKFKYAKYDDLLEQLNPPITNDYTMYYVDNTNYQIHARKVLRVITQPDIFLQAQDLADGPAGINFNDTVIRDINFDGQTNGSGQATGIIDRTVVFNYNRVGSIFENGPFGSTNSFINPYSVNETTQIPLLQWASYDGSTNPPVIYPNGTSVQNLEYQSVVQISPSSIPAEPASYYSTNGVQFKVVSGPLSAPYTWSASSVPGEQGSGLPSGLAVSPAGLLYGVTTATGTFDFTLTVTDSSAVPQSVQWTYSITLQ